MVSRQTRAGCEVESEDRAEMTLGITPGREEERRAGGRWGKQETSAAV